MVVSSIGGADGRHRLPEAVWGRDVRHIPVL
jgi:hypothetical protein